MLDVCDTIELRPWFGSEQNGSARTISHRHVSCGAVARCTQGFVSLSFVGSVHAAAWVIKLTGLSKHMSRVWLQLNEVELSSRFQFDYLLTDVTMRSPYSQPHGSGRSVSLWWRAPTTSMVWCIGFKMSWYVCTALQHGSRRRACGSVHCVDVLVAQVAVWFRAECVNSVVGCSTESVVGWSSQPRTQAAQRSAQVNHLVCVSVTFRSCQSWHRLRVLLFSATFARCTR